MYSAEIINPDYFAKHDVDYKLEELKKLEHCW